MVLTVHSIKHLDNGCSHQEQSHYKILIGVHKELGVEGSG